MIKITIDCHHQSSQDVLVSVIMFMIVPFPIFVILTSLTSHILRIHIDTYQLYIIHRYVIYVMIEYVISDISV